MEIVTTIFSMFIGLFIGVWFTIYGFRNGSFRWDSGKFHFSLKK